MYQRPGLRPLVAGPAKPVRGLWQASNGDGYCVIGQGVYYISPEWVLTHLGDVLVNSSLPTSATDNGDKILLVDSSPYGYTINLDTRGFAQFVDPSGSFVGATRVDTIDTFVLANVPGTRNFISTLSNELTFDPLYIAGKSNYPDPLQTLIVNHRYILLMGLVKSEIWYDAGNPTFPFAELPGSYMEHGILAPYSLASQDISTYWLGNDLQGRGIVFQQEGYKTRRISSHALEYTIQQMALRGTISDAIGMTYQLGGHVFYALHFPTGDQTWVHDEAIGDSDESWHQEAWTDSNGLLHRSRMNCVASLYGQIVAGDWQNGTLYAVDSEYYKDTVGGQDYSISFIRGFQHVLSGVDRKLGQLVEANGHVVQHNAFRADLECGNGPLDANGSPAMVTLRWSNDRGKTFRQGVLQSSGAPGQYETQIRWAPLELARDRVYELEYNIAGPAALNGAWVDLIVLEK